MKIKLLLETIRTKGNNFVWEENRMILYEKYAKNVGCVFVKESNFALQ